MSHRNQRDAPVRARRVVTAIAAGMALLTLIGIIILRPRGEPQEDLAQLGIVSDVFSARVEAVEEAPCPGSVPGEGLICLSATFLLREGPDEGSTTAIGFPLDSPGLQLSPGDEVVLSYTPDAEPGFQYSFADQQRRPVLFWLALLFSLAVVALGRLRGLAALAGLGASMFVLLQFILPAVVEGRHPLSVAVVGAAAIAYLALYLAHGFRTMTTVALLGTLASLALTATLAEVFVTLARITGFASEEALIVTIGASQIDLGGLILAGVVIGALGAIDDVTVTQASAVWEIHEANPRMSSAALLRAGLRIGRDHVASTVNTLALAYAGASMPLLILFTLSNQSLGTVANGETVATEIVRTLVGSIGLVASVPVTTWLASRTVTAGRRRGRRD